MPRVKLGTPTPAQQRAVMNKIIKKAMVDCDIEDYTDLGLQMGMSRQAVSRRMNDGGWKDEELWRLVRVLKLSAELRGLDCARETAQLCERLQLDTGKKVEVQLELGSLHIEWAENGHVFMTGPAAFVFDGEYDVRR